MKAIILAAGMGNRLGALTRDKPKGMVDFFGAPLLSYQLEVLRSVGISDITIVRGYRSEKISFSQVRYYENHDFAQTNMVETLFCAQEQLQGELLVLYSDIIYEPRVVRAAIHSRHDIGVVVDSDFRDYWCARVGSVLEDSESLTLNQGGEIVEIGSPSPTIEKLAARYVGMLRFSDAGVKELQSCYQEQRQRHFESSAPWYHSPCFKKGYMTDLIQCLIDRRVRVCSIPIKRGWLEIDTERDLELYQEWCRSGKLQQFIDLKAISQRFKLPD